MSYFDTFTFSHYFTLHADESPEKVGEVLNKIADEYFNGGKPAGIEDELRIWRCAQTLLERHRVKIPFVKSLPLYFPKNTVRVQRDFKRFLSLIEVSCLLHQYQREKEGECLIATIDDYGIAHEVGSVVLAQTLKGVSSEAEKLLEKIKDLGTQRKVNVSSFERKDIDSEMKWGPRKSNRYLRSLQKEGYITIVDSGRGKPTKYAMEGNVQLNISLPTPDALQKIIDDGVSDRPTSTETPPYKGPEPGHTPMSNSVLPVQPPPDRDNPDIAGQSEDVQVESASDKGNGDGRTPGQGKTDLHSEKRRLYNLLDPDEKKQFIDMYKNLVKMFATPREEAMRMVMDSIRALQRKSPGDD